MEFHVNHPLLFLLAGIIVAAVLAQSVFFLAKAVRRSKAIGMDQTKIRKTIRTAAVFTIAPAIAIVISVIALSKSLGIALPWLRLSVVGSLSYETIAAENAVSAMGLTLGKIDSLTAQQYVNITLVMTISIMVGIWLVPVIGKRLQNAMLGAGGSYLSFVTGNISNLKLPCAINALEQNEVSANSEEGELISTIAIATSSIVTTIIIVIGVVAIVPLTPILEAKLLEPAFAQMLPALFGGLGVAFVSQNWKIAITPVLLMLVLFIFVSALNAGTVGIMVPVSVLFTILISRILYKRGVL